MVVDQQSKIPLFEIEFDGPHHKDIRQKTRDIKKNRMCSLARFPLLRVNNTHIYEHDKTTLLEYMLRRYSAWPAERKRLTGEITEYISTLTEEQFDHLTEGGVADPSIDPQFLFNLDDPFPGVTRVAERLYRQFGIVTDLHKIRLDRRLCCHTQVIGFETSPRWVATCGYVLYRPHSAQHLQSEHHYFDIGDGGRVYEGSVRFGMDWGLPTAEDWQPDEVPFEYFRRTHRLPLWFGDPPGIQIPDIVEWFSKYLALYRVETWAKGHLDRIRSPVNLR